MQIVENRIGVAPTLTLSLAFDSRCFVCCRKLIEFSFVLFRAFVQV